MFIIYLQGSIDYHRINHGHMSLHSEVDSMMGRRIPPPPPPPLPPRQRTPGLSGEGIAVLPSNQGLLSRERTSSDMNSVAYEVNHAYFRNRNTTPHLFHISLFNYTLCIIIIYVIVDGGSGIRTHDSTCFRT